MVGEHAAILKFTWGYHIIDFVIFFWLISWMLIIIYVIDLFTLMWWVLHRCLIT
jgi:hypothetical protein